MKPRITPACAGTTCALWRPRRARRDHPRVCGDYLLKCQNFVQVQGSPPRVRGLPYFQSTYLPDLRITPACAGTTIPRSGCCPGRWDHPRVCGDYRAAIQ